MTEGAEDIGGKLSRIPGAQYRYLMDNAPLTDDERIILTRLRRGDSQGLIAYDLHIDPRTVRRKMAAIQQVIDGEMM